MNKDRKPSPEILREAILQLDEPVLFKSILINEDVDNNWRLFQLPNLTKLLTDDYCMEKLPFRVGVNAPTSVNIYLLIKKKMYLIICWEL